MCIIYCDIICYAEQHGPCNKLLSYLNNKNNQRDLDSLYIQCIYQNLRKITVNTLLQRLFYMFCLL